MSYSFTFTQLDGQDQPSRSKPHPGPNGLFWYQLNGHLIRMDHVTVVPSPGSRCDENFSCIVVESDDAIQYPIGLLISCSENDLMDGDVVDVPLRAVS